MNYNLLKHFTEDATASPYIFVDIGSLDGLGWLLGLDRLSLDWLSTLALAMSGHATVGAFACGDLDRFLGLEKTVKVLW